ncbi:MAG TPA: PocR ligand-binding domain-containing protein [Candidatus Hydrogenedentes bacterium]|nr:PocR ligand-binding domain-containing protein [Candidatus Hydrogenedentota bacterium]
MRKRKKGCFPNLLPEEALSPLSISDIIDMDMLQLIQDAYARVAGVSSTIMRRGVWETSPSGTIALCMKYLRELTVTGSQEKRCVRSDCLDEGVITIIHKEDTHHSPPFWIYWCHAGLVDFCTPILDEAGREIALFYGGQVVLAGQDDYGHTKRALRDATISQEDTKAYLEGLRLNRKKTLHELIAAAILARSVGQAIMEIYYQRQPRRPLEFSYDTIHRILARAAKMGFLETLSVNGVHGDIQTHLYFLDPDTNRFAWRRKQEEGEVDPASDPKSVDFLLNQTLWDVFKSKKMLWLLPCPNVPEPTLGLFLPLIEATRVLGVFHIHFPNEAYIETGGMPVHCERDIRVAELAMKEVANLHRNHQIMALMERKVKDRLWVKKTVDNILTVREAMEQAAQLGNRAFFWYACLIGLTHADGFGFNRAAIYDVELTGAKRKRLEIRAVYAVGTLTRGDWNSACGAGISLVEMLKDLDIRCRTTVPLSPETYGLDLGWFDKKWAAPEGGLLEELRELGDAQALRAHSVPFEYVPASCEAERNCLDRKWYAGYAPTEDGHPRHILFCVQAEHAGDSKNARLLYLDDVWQEVQWEGNTRREQRAALEEDRLLDRFVVQTKTMLRNLDAGFGYAAYLSHTLLGDVTKALIDIKDVGAVPEVEKGRYSAFYDVEQSLKRCRNFLAIHARAEKIWAEPTEVDVVAAVQDVLETHELYDQVATVEKQKEEVGSWFISGSPALFQAALSEVIENAISHGGRTVRWRLTVTWRRPDKAEDPLVLEICNPKVIAPEMERYVNGQAEYAPPRVGHGLPVLKEWFARCNVRFEIQGNKSRRRTWTRLSFPPSTRRNA